MNPSGSAKKRWKEKWREERGKVWKLLLVLSQKEGGENEAYQEEAYQEAYQEEEEEEGEEEGEENQTF